MTTTDIETIIDNLSTKLLTKITALQQETQMEDEFFATVVSGTINSSVDGAIKIFDMSKRHELADKDILLKDAQILGENIKNGNVAISHTYDAAGNVLTTVYGDGTSKSIYEAQRELVEKQILDVTSSTSVRNAQSAKDLLVKAEQITYMSKQSATETNKALDIVSSTSVRNAQSAKDLLVKAEQITYMSKQSATETNKALDIVSSTSVRNAQSAKDLLVKAEQITYISKQSATETNKALDIVSSTTARNELKDKDKLIKDQQVLGEIFKNGGANFTYTYDVNGAVASKTLSAGTKMSIYEAQANKTLADVAFTNEQKIQLGYSVIYNNRLKTLEDYGNILGNLGMGGFVVPTGMWTTYFGMMNDCYINWGNVPASKSFTTATTYPTLKAV